MHRTRSSRRSAGVLAALALLTGLQGTALAAARDTTAAAGPGGQADALPPGPGPGLLYEEAPVAPQFQNVGVWEADPLYVMGSNAHVDGEYVYQGFVFDDFGADTGYPRSHPHTGAALYQSAGDVHYPTDEATYASNAADLLEFRVTEDRGQLKYRVTLNTMIKPDVAGIAIGIDTDGDPTTGTDDWGHGIGELGGLGLDHVLMTWGTGAQLVSHGPDGRVERPVVSTVDLERNQIELTVPLDPGTETWRHHLVTGLYDPAEKGLQQVEELPSADAPGGAFLTEPPPVFDVGFRHHDQEPWTSFGEVPSATAVDPSATQPGDAAGAGYWRDAAKARALAEEDISEFFADIDFGKLQRRVTSYDVPRSGLVNGVYGSRFDLGGEGVRTSEDPMMVGRVQPYALYIPEDFSADEPTPLFLQLHGGSSMHNQILSAPNFVREFGEERDALLLAPLGRGPSGNRYDGAGELDVFEALAHVDRQYDVDLDQLMIGGPSTGGEGTMKVAGRYPDLFDAVFCLVAGTFDEVLLDNYRNLPLLLWSGVEDHRTPWWSTTHAAMLQRGFRHEQGIFPGYGHVRHYVEDEWGPAREYLDGQVAGLDHPWHVTYHADPAAENRQWGLEHDKAYWLSGISVADGAATGKVDARDRAAGRGEPETSTYQEHRSQPDQHVASGLRWREPLLSPRPVNRLELDLEGVDAVTVWVDATKLDPSRPVEVVSQATGGASVTLISRVGTRVLEVPAGASSSVVQLR